MKNISVPLYDMILLMTDNTRLLIPKYIAGKTESGDHTAIFKFIAAVATTNSDAR